MRLVIYYSRNLSEMDFVFIGFRQSIWLQQAQEEKMLHERQQVRLKLGFMNTEKTLTQRKARK